MRVIGINGSPRKNANTAALVQKILSGAREKGAETATFNLNELNIKPCQSCNACKSREGCIQKDDMQEIYRALNEADALVLGSPIYMFQMSAQSKTFLDRLYAYYKSPITDQNKGKKVVLAFTQAHPDANAYQAYFEHTASVFKLFDTPVQEIIVATGNSGPKDTEKQTDLMEKAKLVGSKLIQA